MKKSRWLVRPIVVAVSGCFGAVPAWANPTAPQVINGAVQIQGLGTNQLKVINSPNAIIHWQGFSIGAGQVTQFQQQSAASAVLNRVVGPDISSIQGSLLSNGRVFLINPAGIIVGPGGVIDTAGFVGSTLNMLDGDFLAGRLRFQGDASAGSFVNAGWIRAGQGGNVVLIAPNIQNSGVVQTTGGDIILAAGQKMTIGSPRLEGVQFEVQAPADSAVNVGKLIAEGGAVGVFAGTLRHSGDIRATALARDEAGHVVLKSQKDTIVEGNATIAVTNANGRGGTVQVLGERVSLTGNTLVDASGASGGGTVLIGGDYQGANAAMKNASSTFVGPNAMLRADATDSGDGGRVIVWADKATQFYGALSARGGSRGGDGGFAEVSGKQNLIFAGTADLGAPKGRFGTLLLDPLDLYADSTGGLNTEVIDEPTDFPDNAITVSPTALANMNANVTLYAGRYMRFGSPITLNLGRSLTATVATYTPLLHATGVTEGTPPNRMDIAANIATNNAPVTLSAPAIRSFEVAPGIAPVIATGGGNVTLSASGGANNGAIDGNTFGGLLTIAAGSGAVSLASTNSNVTVGALTGGSLTANGAGVTTGALVTTGGALTLTSTGGISTGALTTAGGALTLTSTGGGISTRSIDTAGGALTATGSGFVNLSNTTGDSIQTGGGPVTLKSTASDVQTRSILAGSGPVEMEGNNVTSTPAASVIDTTGTVKLTARNGSIDVRVNNSSGVTASAKSAFSNVSVNIDSTGILNVTSASAETTGCPNFNSCSSASVILDSTGGNVSVGTLTAKAPIFAPGSFLENVSETVTVRTHNAGNSILALSGSLIKATDVVLRTDPLSGGRIGSAASPINVDVKRTFTFTPNGPFNVVLDGGPGPNQLVMNIGVMPTGGVFSNSTVSGSGVTLDVSADASAVTVNNLTLTDVAGGFSSVVVRSPPKLDLLVPNGALVATKVEVPQGGGIQNGVSGAFAVTLRAQGAGANDNLTLTEFTRNGGANPSILALGSSNGKVTIGKVQAANDAVTVDSTKGDIDFLPGPAGSLTTGGAVNLTSTSGNITLGTIDTSSGSDVVNVSATNTGVSAGNIFARDAGAALEVSGGGTVTLSGQRMGAAGKPLNLAGPAVRLITRSPNGRVGDVDALTAATPDLTIDTSLGQAAAFTVDTTTVDLVNLNVKTVPSGGRVTSNGVNYSFGPGFAPPNPITQFNNGTLTFEVTSGDLTLGAIRLPATASLVLRAPSGSITGGQPIDAQNVTLAAATKSVTGAPQVNVGAIGGVVPFSNLNITAGFRNNNFDFQAASVTTGALTPAAGGNVQITTFQGAINLGAGAAIGSAAVPAGSVTLTAERTNTSGDGSTGTIATGDIFASSITLRAGPQDGASGIRTGALDADSITIDGIFNAGIPKVFINSIGGTTPVSTLNVFNAQNFDVTGGITGADSSTINVNSDSITLGGAVTAGTNSTVILNARSGGLTLGPAGAGEVTAGTDSTIQLTHKPGTATPLTFAKLDASATGSVGITTNPASTGVRQTAAGTGIRAQSVTFDMGTGTTGNITDDAGTGPIKLDSVKSLSITAGGVIRLDAQNTSALDSFSFLRNGANVFSLANLTGQTITITNAAAPTVVATTSPGSALDFSLTNTVGGITLGSQMLTAGGTVRLNAAGPLDASMGIDATGTATPDTRGSVTLITGAPNSQITAGPISTPPTATTDIESPRAIAISTSGTASPIVLNGNIDSGTNGGPIRISTAGSSITGAGVVRSQSPDSVYVTSTSGDIGTNVQRLQVDSPSAHLSTSGNVFARLTNTVGATSNLDLTAGNGFDVTSAQPFDTLLLSTRANGTGNLSLTVDGNPQTYTFSRPVVDLFGNVLAAGSTLEVSAATGAGAGNPTRTEFTASQGDLLVRGGASLTAANLKLDAPGGKLMLQGSSASPLVVANAATQIFSANGDVDVKNKVTLTTGEQTITSTTGNILFTAGGAANEAIALTASGRQLISTDSGRGGNVVAQGGSTDGTSVTFTFNGAVNGSVDSNNAEQQIEARGEVRLWAGGGSGASVLVTGNQRQLVRAGNNAGSGTVHLRGGGPNASAEIVNSGDAIQQVGENRVFCCFPPYPYSTPNITLEGGAGSEAHARILGGAGQQVIQSRFGTVALNAGTGTNAYAAIDTMGVGQQTLSGIGTLQLMANSGPGAVARVSSTNSFQSITVSNALTLTANAAGNNAATITGAGQLVNGGANLTLSAAAAPNAEARIESSANQTLGVGNAALIASSAPAQIIAQGTQSINAGTLTLTAAAATARISAQGSQSVNAGDTTLTAAAASASISSQGNQTINTGNTTLTGGSSVGSVASIVTDAPNFGGTEQRLSFANLTLNGGTAADAVARIRATNGNQRFTFFSSISMNGGSATGAFASIDALNGTQRFDSGGNITLNAGNIAGPVANAGAIIEGRSQQIASFGTLTLNGRAGGAGTSSEALIRNLALTQSITPNQIVMNGGTQYSAAGIVNMGTGAQTVTASNGIALNGNAVGANARADVYILNMPATLQTVTANNGAIALANAGTGAVSITSGGRQSFTSSGVSVATSSSGSSTIMSSAEQRLTSTFIDVMTAAAATGDAKIAAAGNQWIHTTNGTNAPMGGGSIGVRALGSGIASIESGGRQLLEIDYPELKQTTPTPPGSLVIGATNGAGTSRVQGVDQRIFARTVSLQGGSAANATAKLTGTNAQTISVLDGPINVFAGTGAGATAGIDPLTQTIVANNSTAGGNAIDVRGAASGGGAGASIAGTNTQTIVVSRGGLAVTGAAGPATIQSTNGPQTITAAEGFTLSGGGSAAGTAQALSGGAQTLKFATLALTANAANVLINTTGLQTLTGGTLSIAGGGAGASGTITTAGAQSVNVTGSGILAGGTGTNAFARLLATGAQTLRFGTLTMTAGNAAGAYAKIDTPAAQTITGGPGAMMLTASANAPASIEGQSQTFLCGGTCGSLVLQGASGTAANAQIRNLAGVQSISTGAISLFGGASGSTTGILNEGTTQVVNASGFILLQSHPNATGTASVVVQNPSSAGQTISASQDITLSSSGGGTVAMTSGGAQSIDARGLDVLTSPTSPTGANATVSALGDQTIHTRGSLLAEPGVGMRVASRSTGTAQVVSTGNQTINVDGNQLLIGRLAVGLPGLPSPNASTQGSPAAGDSLVLATSETTNPDQTVTAGSMWIQGPTGNDRISKLSGDGAQKLTTGRLHLIGGAGQNAFAQIDPTTQTVTSAGDIFIQGGTGPNADALINATGPQTIISQNGAITLIGGSGQGADALIVTTSPFQTVSALNGVNFVQGPSNGGAARLQQGSNLAASQIVTNTVTGQVLREQDQLEELREDFLSGDYTQSRGQQTDKPQKATLCN